jgi:hypothetical protein
MSIQEPQAQPPPPATYHGVLNPLPVALRDLTTRPIWVVWTWEWRVGKDGKGAWTKPPRRVGNTKQYAAVNDCTTWGSYSGACLAVEQGRADGIGLMLPDTDIAALDPDGCRDMQTGALTPWAQALVDEANRLGAYTETTVGGRGLRVLGTCANRKLHTVLEPTDDIHIEVYAGGARRFITISGAEISNPPCQKLPDITPLLDSVLQQYGRKPKDQKHQGDSSNAADNGFAAHSATDGTGFHYDLFTLASLPRDLQDLSSTAHLWVTGRLIFTTWWAG